MKLTINTNNDAQRFSRSSKDVKPLDINNEDKSFPKITINESLPQSGKINSSLKKTVQNVNPNINISTCPNEPNFFAVKSKIKNTHIMKPSKKGNHFHANFLHLPNQNDLNRSRLSINNGQLSQKTRNTIIDAINKSQYVEKNSKTNLKLVQKELQYKLLDMSIQIENTLNTDEETSNNFSSLKIDNNNFWGRNVNKEFEASRMDLRARRSSANFNDLSKLVDPNKSIINSGFSRCHTNKFLLNNNMPNITLFRRDLNKTNINANKNNRRKSFNFNTMNRNNNNISFNFLNGNNKSMYLKSNNNTLMNKNSMSFIMNNKSMYINRNNINVNKMLLTTIQNKEYENKYRLIYRTKELYDSFEDEEIVEEMEEEYYYISPETHEIFIFDVFMLLCILFCCFFYPIYIAQSICFCSYIPVEIIVICFLTDFLNIFDILLSFFRAYYNFEFVLVKKNDKIVKHYLKRYFFPDIITAIPIFSFSYFLCKKDDPDGLICFMSGIDLRHNFLKICLGLKTIKLFKVLDRKYNRGINYYYDKISENYTLEKTMKMALFGLLCILGFNIFICYHIYIGRQNYPNWITATNNQDKNFLHLYMISCYFLITTITSVGYGDITCVSLGETIFQIIILTIGVIAYSWVVSTVGNYVKKETRAAIKYNKDIGLLEEIRISYPKMSFKLYNKIQKHLEAVSQQQERFDTNLLVNNLPYTLKNQLMFIIYGNIIKKFNFFKECENSDFILRILTSFIPMKAKKGAFIIHEGELVDNIIFVKEGRLSLIAAIDLDNPSISIDNYLGEKFADINDKMETELDNSALNKSMNIGLKIEKAQTEIRTFLKTKNDMDSSNIEQEIAKLDYDGDGDDFEIGNHQFLNILDILKNEHFGEVYMFLQKPSPLSLRVKSKYAQLFLLRKHEAMMISKAYPNVWKKIYQKSYHNMKSIKRKTKKIIIHYCQNYGHKYDIKKGMDVMRNDSEHFIVNLGVLNRKKRKHKKAIHFNLNNNYNDKNEKADLVGYSKKPNLKQRIEHHNSLEHLQNTTSTVSYGIESNLKQKDAANKAGFVFQINGMHLNKMTTNQKNSLNSMNKISTIMPFNQMSKMKTINGNKRSSHVLTFGSETNFSHTVNPKDDLNLHQSNPKLIAKYSNDSLFKKMSNKIGITNMNSINNESIKKKKNKIISNFDKNYTMNNNMLRKMNSNVAVKSNSILIKNKDKIDSNYFSSLSFKGKNSALNTQSQQCIENPSSDITETKIIQSSNFNNTALTQRVIDNNEAVDKNPNTINNLSRPLIKKIQKKIKKRRQRKKLYKMLVEKISASLLKINPNSNINFNLNSSINNSFNNVIIKNDSTIPNNMPIGYGLQSNVMMQENSMTSDNINEVMVNPLAGQELLIIPESPEFDSESSSENSKSSNDSNTLTLPEKKQVELSISENFSFSYSTTYDNMDSISEGNYSKDVNLRKSVMKLIGFYLKEKAKKKNKPSEKRENSENNINSHKKEKEKEKEKSNKKERNSNKETEKDVWAFLNEEEDREEPNENLKFRLGTSSSRNSSYVEEKNISKTPKNKVKRNMGFTGEMRTKSRFKKNNSNIYVEKEQNDSSPKTRKKKDFSKKKTKQLKKATTINPKKVKKIQKKEKYVSNKDSSLENNLKKKENSNKDTILSSLDLTLNDDHIVDGYKKNYYKTFKKKVNNNNNNNDDYKEGSSSIIELKEL